MKLFSSQLVSYDPTYCGLTNTQDDPDIDGVSNYQDNCSTAVNTRQRDTDGDNYGTRCYPDFDNNGVVNASDLAQLKSRFFTADPDADLYGDGVVNVGDLVILKSMFFNSPGLSALAP